MTNIRADFLEISVKHPELSSYICFARAVRDKNYESSYISIWFGRLVEKEDYFGENRAMLIFDLSKLSRGQKLG